MLHQPVQPFKTTALHKTRRLALAPGRKIKSRADANQHWRIKPGLLRIHPVLLLWRSKPNPDDVRPRSVDLRNLAFRHRRACRAHWWRQRQAPRIVQRSGFEWLYRLVQHPRRLARRYIINNPRFVGLLLAQLLGWRAYSLD